MVNRMNDLISKLSEIRSEYNCFNQDEEPYYRALSEVISILSRQKDGDTISRQAASGCEYWDNESNFCALYRPSAERNKQITSEMDETFRMASEIRLAVGCNTSRECWELARKGEIKRVKHGQWIIKKDVTFPHMVCSECKKPFYGNIDDEWDYCPHCGAKMDKVLT